MFEVIIKATLGTVASHNIQLVSTKNRVIILLHTTILEKLHMNTNSCIDLHNLL
jgi:hypothetical protein